MDVGDAPGLDPAVDDEAASCSRQHRYELAAALVKERRVLHISHGAGDGTTVLERVAANVVTVERDEAVSFLNSGARDDFDVVIWLDGLDRADVLESAVQGLRRLTEEGVSFLGSIQNRLLLAEGEPGAGYLDIGELEALVGPLGDVSVLYQFAAEASLISPAQPGELQGRFGLAAPGEPEYASSFIVAVNLKRELAEINAQARIQASVVAVHSRLLRNLEKANHELWQINTRLARQARTTFDSAAGALVMRHETEAERAKQERDNLKEELSARADELERLRLADEALRQRKLVRLALAVSRLRARLRI